MAAERPIVNIIKASEAVTNDPINAVVTNKDDAPPDKIPIKNVIIKYNVKFNLKSVKTKVTINANK